MNKINVLNDEDALNEDEEVDALMEYLEEPVRRSNPKIFLRWILKNECAWNVCEEWYANAGILCYISTSHFSFVRVLPSDVIMLLI